MFLFVRIEGDLCAKGGVGFILPCAAIEFQDGDLLATPSSP